MRATTAIKTEIIEAHPQFQAVPKKADLIAEVAGRTIRVDIKKGEARAIRVDGQTVWAPKGGWNALQALENLPTLCKQVDLEPVSLTEVRGTETRGRKVVVTDTWIQTLTEEANKSRLLPSGHSIRLRVATSHGKPVTACVDIFRGEEKIASGGREKKIGFAASGITQAWRQKVDDAVAHAFSKVKKA